MYSKVCVDCGPSLPECKECGRQRKLDYRKNNPEKVRAQDRARYQRSKPKRLDAANRFYRENKEKILKQKKEYGARPDVQATKKEWQKNNRDKISLYNKKQTSRIENRIRSAISTRIWKALKLGVYSSSFEGLLGYSIDDLKHHLESRFRPGMTFENYGKWHIDHIIPVSKFKYASPSDVGFKECWSLGNLQPLWAKENIAKGNR